MPNGGSITIKTSPVFAESGGPLFGVMKSGPAALISVSDTGTGIDEETQKRLFEPFFTNKKPGKGTGLGLATASGIIAQSGGHISLESQVGKGTTFYVCLPLRNSECDSGS
jgi:signal transduction histidine kinase